jgi:hypothetical protein
MTRARPVLRNRFNSIPFLTLILGLLIPSATAIGQGGPQLRAGRGSSDDPLRVPRTESSIRIDGALDEAAWESALTLELPFEVMPGENTPAPVRTEVLLLFDDNHLYAAFRCYDPDPTAIQAHLSDRDRLGSDDWVGIVLDTFNDERRCYQLQVNPLGVQRDQVEAESGGDNPRDVGWDAIWASAGRITDWGYSVELAVPFTQLRFQRRDTSQIWGFDGVRYYPRSVEHTLAAFPRDRSNSLYLSQALKIEGFEGITPGRSVGVFPTATTVRTDARNGMPSGSFDTVNRDTELGISSSWGITPNMTMLGALNPDFSQVEADALQLDINTPFALFYPERRPFFVEGADFFSTLKSAIYTRAIRDPQWGLKLTGKEGNQTVGAYMARDEFTNIIFPGSQGSAAATIPGQSTASVLRLKRDLGRRFTIGGLVTNRQAGDYSNLVLGFDGDFRLTPTNQIQIQVLESRTRYPDAIATQYSQKQGDFSGHFIAFEYDHVSRTLGWWLDYDNASSDFRADVGFMPMVDFQNVEGGWSYTWNARPGSWWSLMRVGGEFNYYEDQRDNLLRQGASLWASYQGHMQSWAFLRAYRFRNSYLGAEYDLNYYQAQAGFRPANGLVIGMSAWLGDRIDFANNRLGDRINIGPLLVWNAGIHLRLEMNHNYERLTVPGGRLYTANISQFRTVYQFNVRTFLRAIFQYTDYQRNTGLYTFPIDAEDRRFFTQVLFSYQANPLTVLYLGASENRAGTEVYGLTRQDWTVFAKVGYALAF